MNKFIFIFIISIPIVATAKNLVSDDAALMAEAKQAYKLDHEVELRCAALGLDNVRKVALYRLISRRLQGELDEVREGKKTISPALENAKVANPNSATKDLKQNLELFGQPELVKFIQNMSDVVYDRLGQPLKVTGTTVSSSNPQKDVHCTHAHGLSVDFRPMPGIMPNTWHDTDKTRYDREMNKAVIKFLIAAPEVRRIFFNDPMIMKDSEVMNLVAQRKKSDPSFDYRELTYTYTTPTGEQKTVQHDNHVHVEVKGDPTIWQYTNDVYKKLSGASQ